MVLVLLPVRAVLADPRVRIDLERETHKKVVVAVTDFVLDDSIADFMGIGNEAKFIKNPLCRLSMNRIVRLSVRNFRAIMLL